MITAIVSTGLGLVLAAVTHRIEAAYISIVLPGSMLFIRYPPRSLRPRGLGALLTFPFSRLFDQMGEDMQNWCDATLREVSAEPQWIADAVNYYYDQVAGRLKDRRERADVDDWRESITYKIGIVRLISLDTTPGRLREALQTNLSTRATRYSGDNLLRLARRLESDALNELNMFLALIYRRGYGRRLPLYMSAGPLSRAQAWARP
jgi:hypothetical protein